MSAQLDALRAFVATRPVAHAGAAAPSPAGPAVLVVGSGKGGAGTSVVAALVALAAAAAGKRTLLVDADPHVGPQRWLLGIAAGAPSLADLRAGLDVAAVATPVSATLTVVAGGPPTAAGAAPADAAEHRALLRRVAALYPGHDLIVVDGGSRLDTVCACCEAGAPGSAGVPARLLIVTGTEPIALAASYALVKAAAERTAALPGGPVAAEVIVNRHDEEAAMLGFAQVAQACRDFLGAANAGVRLAGMLPDDASLAVALRAGMPLQEAATGSPAAVAAQALTERLLAALATPPPRAASRVTQAYGSPAPRPLPSALPSAARAAALTGAYR